MIANTFFVHIITYMHATINMNPQGASAETRDTPLRPRPTSPRLLDWRIGGPILWAIAHRNTIDSRLANLESAA